MAGLGRHEFFYLDWRLNIYRCHNWKTPMCHIRDFDAAPRIRDGCTACMTDCYRDDSVTQHVAIAASDGAGSGKGPSWRSPAPLAGRMQPHLARCGVRGSAALAQRDLIGPKANV